MLPVAPSERESLRHFFLPERSGSQVAQMVIRSGQHAIFVDRMKDPRTVIVVTPQDMVLAGDPTQFTPPELLVFGFRGLIEAGPEFLPLLRRTYADLDKWPRVIGTLEGGDVPDPPPNSIVRRLVPGDGMLARTLDHDLHWIWKYFGDPDAMAASGRAWGAIVEGKLASIALPFTWAEEYEDIGVVTDSGFRCRGLSPACTAPLIEDIKGRGRIPSWSTTPDNAASLRVAGKLGFRKDRDDVLYTTGWEVQEPEIP